MSKLMKSHLYSIILIFILFKAEAKKEEYSVQSLTPVMVSNRLGLPNISFDTKTYTASGNPISSPVPFLLKNRGILFNLFTAPSLVASQMPNKNYDVILKISANFKDNSGNLQTKEFELKINYNTNGEIKYKAKDEYYINGIGWCNFTIISQIIKDESGNLITASEANNWFTFKSQLQVERFYKPNPNSTVTPYPNFFPVTTPFPSSPRVESPIPKSVIFRKSGNNGYITVLWNPVYWAEYYELEYLS